VSDGNNSTYRKKNFYQAAYLMTTMDVESVLEGREFVFLDETGEVEWAAESFFQDQTVGKFCASLKKLKRLYNLTTYTPYR